MLPCNLHKVLRVLIDQSFIKKQWENFRGNTNKLNSSAPCLRCEGAAISANWFFFAWRLYQIVLSVIASCFLIGHTFRFDATDGCVCTAITMTCGCTLLPESPGAPYCSWHESRKYISMDKCIVKNIRGTSSIMHCYIEIFSVHLKNLG